MLDCYISTICLERHTQRRDVIRRCLPEFSKQERLAVAVFDFGSTEEQKQWLSSLPQTTVYSSSPYRDLSWVLEGSERRRFLFANRLSLSSQPEADSPGASIYIVADDDLLPVTKEWVAEGKRIIDAHPQFGMLCLDEGKNRQPKHGLYFDEEVVETLSCGGIRFIRKGIVESYPGYGHERGFDRLHARAMQAAGFKVGFFRKLIRNHLGGRCSVYRERPAPTKENDRIDAIAHV